MHQVGADASAGGAKDVLLHGVCQRGAIADRQRHLRCRRSWQIQNWIALQPNTQGTRLALRNVQVLGEKLLRDGEHLEARHTRGIIVNELSDPRISYVVPA
jgi:hypothetical protein